MAGKALMSQIIFVVDTSYLLELFGIPNFSNEASITEVRRRFRGAVAIKATFIVPLPCLFELGNHIADIPQGGLRHKKAAEVSATVQSSFETGNPWTITPAETLNAIQEVFTQFANQYVLEAIGLTDSFTIHEALRLKLENVHRDCLVHIWTRDNALKAREPDTEENPFV